ncbi:hypothetical protein DACRYDRAFT_114822 [Dacryopinax primogenitus]|uniref:Carotenoid oxygenase n=1 Tax=Dacryopinax primogenitus (strain DJM 731) TaxID=1858805 RepID=M5G2R4_DACPD|nr:uncharacterized protein DACRYDRAFT_114822 [Dacryopinax primogenitus]EJU04516.1 hypothetical protein DACRYDRAFT_114822 [Dacryopinax primogenitus]
MTILGLDEDPHNWADDRTPPPDLHAANELAFSNAPETLEPISLPVQGTLSPWLQGVLYRTGPGTYSVPSPKAKGGTVDIQHWFDALGINHRFSISPKGVEYSARKSCLSAEEEIAREGKVPGITFGETDPCEKLFHKSFAAFRRTLGSGQAAQTHKKPDGQNAQVTFSLDMPGFPRKKIPDRLVAREPKAGEGPKYLVAKTDASLLQLLDPDTLEPLALAIYRSVHPELTGELAAAHACTDFKGAYYNFVVNVGPRPVYKVFRISKDGEVKILAEVTDAPLAYIHSFAMTGRYVILCVWASEITNYGLSVLYHGNLAQSISTTPTHPTTFYVIDRHSGGLVAKYTTPPFFCFHQLNAYDDPETEDVIIDLAAYPDASFIQLLYVKELRQGLKEQFGKARRYRLSDPSKTSAATSATREAQVEWTTDGSIELPTVRPEVYHKPYRFAYTITLTRNTLLFADTIVKFDVSTSPPTAQHWYAAPGQTVGEALFVSRPGSTEEDDGVLLTVVLDGVRRRSFLLVLDARTRGELARAEAPEGKWLSAGFHGVFI